MGKQSYLSVKTNLTTLVPLSTINCHAPLSVHSLACNLPYVL